MIIRFLRQGVRIQLISIFFLSYLFAWGGGGHSGGGHRGGGFGGGHPGGGGFHFGGGSHGGGYHPGGRPGGGHHGGPGFVGGPGFGGGHRGGGWDHHPHRDFYRGSPGYYGYWHPRWGYWHSGWRGWGWYGSGCYPWFYPGWYYSWYGANMMFLGYEFYFGYPYYRPFYLPPTYLVSTTPVVPATPGIPQTPMIPATPSGPAPFGGGVEEGQEPVMPQTSQEEMKKVIQDGFYYASAHASTFWKFCAAYPENDEVVEAYFDRFAPQKTEDLSLVTEAELKKTISFGENFRAGICCDPDPLELRRTTLISNIKKAYRNKMTQQLGTDPEFNLNVSNFEIACNALYGSISRTYSDQHSNWPVQFDFSRLQIFVERLEKDLGWKRLSRVPTPQKVVPDFVLD